MFQERARNKNKRFPVEIAATRTFTAERDLSPRNHIASSWILSGMIAGILTVSASTARAAEELIQQSQAQRQYDIPAGALDRALKTFASQAGMMLSVDAALTAGKTSPGLKGNHTIAEGFEVLLAGAGLEAKETDAGSYSLRTHSAESNAATATDQSANVQTLGKIKVESDLAPDGSAEQGYLSETVSAVGPWQGRSLQDTPYSITVISSELIESLQATTPDQIFRISPTTMLSRAQYEVDNPYVVVRGFTLSTPYRDGMQGDGYGNATTTEDAERVEVLSGLSGFLYGPGNVGGLMNYVSKRPTAERLNRITVGNNGGRNYYGQGDFGGPIDSNGRFSYRVNAVWQDGETAIENMDIDKRFFSGALDWHITDALLLKIDAADRSYEVFGNQPYWSFASGTSRPSASRIDTSISYSQPWTRSYSEVQRYGARLEWSASEILSIRAGWRESAIEGGQNAAFNAIQANGTYNQRVSNFVAPDVDPMLWQVDTSVGSIFADIRFTTGLIQHKLTTGMQYVASRQERFSNYAPDITYTGLTLDRPTYFATPVPGAIDRGPRIKVAGSRKRNIMVGDDIAFNPRWSALIGVARSTIDVDEVAVWNTPSYGDSAVTPTLSLIYKPVEAVTTYVSYIESLEQGGAAAEEFNGYPVVNAGQVFKPLTSSQIEVGGKITLSGMLLTAALFEIDKSLQYYDITNPTLPRYAQDGRQVHRGLEFTAVGKATERLTLIGGFTWLDAQIKEQKQNPTLEGKRPTQVADTIAKLRAEYEIPGLQALTLVGGVNYTSSQYADALNTDELPAYTLFDAGARYVADIAQHPLTLRFEVNNLADKRYWTNGSQTGTPRTLVFSVSSEF